jgi:hypothetical protein
MTRRDIVVDEIPFNMLADVINGRGCMMMLLNMSNHAKNVKSGPEFGGRNLCILIGQ